MFDFSRICFNFALQLLSVCTFHTLITVVSKIQWTIKDICFCVVKKINFLLFFPPFVFCLQCNSFLFWGTKKDLKHHKMKRGHSGVFLHIVLFQIQFHFCWWYSKSEHIPQWLSGLLLSAETHSKSCRPFSCRLGESFFRACLVSCDLKSRTPCFGPWIPVSDMAAKHEAAVWQNWLNLCFFKSEDQSFLQIIKAIVAVFY